MKYLFVVFITALFSGGLPRLASGAGEGLRIVVEQHKGTKMRYETPIVYPSQARRNRITGKGVIQVSFDDQGNATKALMVKSTGSRVLDDAATDYAKAYWKSSANNPSTLEVPLVFDL